MDVLTATAVANGEAPFAYEVVLAINGRPLQELLRGVDDPEAWVGPPLDCVKPPSRHLLGGANEWGGNASSAFSEGKVAVLGCACGSPECGALFTTITVMSDVVTWSDMECFKRPDAELGLLAGFTFDREDYEAAVADIHEPATGNGGDHVRHVAGAHHLDHHNV